jgi:negative regulator of flagellin synthesis FlgM
MIIDHNTAHLRKLAEKQEHQISKTNLSKAAMSADVGTADAQKVSVSKSAHILSSANESFDAERVAEIKKRISEGNYKVDVAKIADGLLKSVKDMIEQKTS